MSSNTLLLLGRDHKIGNAVLQCIERPVQLKSLVQRHFAVFIPSRRKIEFLQKNIRQLNVEFTKTNVLHHIANDLTCRSFRGLFDVIRHAENIICGNEQIKKQPTDKQHVEIFLKFNLRFFVSLLLLIAVTAEGILSSSRFDLAMTNIL